MATADPEPATRTYYTAILKIDKMRLYSDTHTCDNEAEQECTRFTASPVIDDADVIDHCGSVEEVTI